LLHDIVSEIAATYDDDSEATMDVDLLTNSVWVPIATALMTDAGIKMAIFSPGIAGILQALLTIS